MLVTGSITEIRNTVRLWKREKLRVAFVPTMGALHDGHIELIRMAREQAQRVVVSVFVNPEQFGPSEDFDRYPRDPEADIRVCRKNRVAAVFMPEETDIYPGPRYFSFQIGELNRHLCGASRPGFFEGVALVVNKLFNIIEPDVAIFGQKDYQQFRILEQMVREFDHDIEMVMCPVVRANDGLALSSRNRYMTNEERLLAPSLYRSLVWIEKQLKSGVDEPSLLIEHQKRELEEKGMRIDYLGVYSHDTLQPVSRVEPGSRYLLAGAVFIGSTRLIDNILIER